jgi:hypothetical protein
VKVFSTTCDSVLSSTGETEKSQGAKLGELGGYRMSHIVFCKEFPGEKGSVRQCAVLMQQPFSVAEGQGQVFINFYRHSKTS